MKPSSGKILWLIIFSIAMGFLEASVVIYIREIYYPDGFSFPLRIMEERFVVIELLREASTIIMLVAIGILAGKTVNQKIASFLVAFAVWDIFYYVFLKLLLNWPESLFTWDILFLIPVPWIGPVLTPCIVCLTMLLLATCLYHRDSQNPASRLGRAEWLLILAGSSVIVSAWTRDYFSLASGKILSTGQAVEMLSSFIPEHFSWWVFAAGEVFILTGIFLFWRRTAMKV
ncbi:MAG: hypothetical protein L0Y35_08700 [Flammeovirgaceae bacterium]|nr:hypothetical protein [Flammeovirgaceae bacterium]